MVPGGCLSASPLQPPPSSIFHVSVIVQLCTSFCPFLSWVENQASTFDSNLKRAGVMVAAVGGRKGWGGEGWSVGLDRETKLYHIQIRRFNNNFWLPSQKCPPDQRFLGPLRFSFNPLFHAIQHGNIGLKASTHNHNQLKPVRKSLPEHFIKCSGWTQRKTFRLLRHTQLAFGIRHISLSLILCIYIYSFKRIFFQMIFSLCNAWTTVCLHHVFWMMNGAMEWRTIGMVKRLVGAGVGWASCCHQSLP